MEKICEICGKTFTRADNLKRHIQAVHRNGEVQCTKCGKTFARADNLKRHVEAVHRNDEVQCEKCFKKFNRKDIMERLKKKCCVCRLCGVDFSNSLELARHHCAEKRVLQFPQLTYIEISTTFNNISRTLTLNSRFYSVLSSST